MHSFPLLVALLIACVSGCNEKPSSRADSQPQHEVITIFAAASTIDVINEAACRFQARGNAEVKCSFDASSTLAKQIMGGAPADVFLSADEKWMDEVEKSGSLDAASRFDLLGNDLVLIVPKGMTLAVRIERGFDFGREFPPEARLALADPSHVPAGRYAQQSLQWLGWWSSVERRIIAAQDVRAALRLVERGEAEAGIVYATDVRASTKVDILGTLPAESHDAIRYPVACVANAPARALEFVRFLRSKEMRPAFEEAGFSVLAAEP